MWFTMNNKALRKKEEEMKKTYEDFIKEGYIIKGDGVFEINLNRVKQDKKFQDSMRRFKESLIVRKLTPKVTS